MNHTEKVASVGAFTAALLSLSCCLPLSIPAALGLAGVSVFASANQLWLIGASVVLLLVGLVQVVRRPACGRRSRLSMLLLAFASVMVVGVVAFPQAIASFMADRLPATRQDPRVGDLALDDLRREFNAASASVRVIVLLSPT